MVFVPGLIRFADQKGKRNEVHDLASVDGVVKKVHVASTAITQDAMRPVAATTISATDAPEMSVDWDFTLDATPA